MKPIPFRSMRALLFCFLIILHTVNSWNRSIKMCSISSSHPTNIRQSNINSRISLLSKCAIVLSPLISKNTAAYAQQGGIKPSSLPETQKAIFQLKRCIDSVVSMETDAKSGNYQAIGDKLSSSDFTTFESAATTIVRSDALSQEDKTTLGTIRRYGIVADAIIMLGGLAGELKSGGVKIAGSSIPVDGVEDTVDAYDDDDDYGSVDKKLTVNVDEVQRYIKLSKDSLQEIYNVVKPILSRST